uniref:Tenascin-like n=1 Tax=Stegastes partitus TaxID=144197 RepID=A0A3B4ZJL5_9TELE
MSGVSQLNTQDITETSVTLVWTPPPVQYETYHLTFTSQKESDQQITVQVEGSLTTFTQTGLAAGQEYSVSIVGEVDGRRGSEISTEFMTLISGPTNLQVVKTTSTSAVVQWEQSQGEIDKYLLTITPNDGAGRSQEMTISAGQNSAHIQKLEAGRLYDVILVAEKGSSRSEPVTTQAVPGQWEPRVTTAALTMQSIQDVGGINQGLNPSPEGQVFDQERRTESSGSAKVRDFGVPDSSISVVARTKPLVHKMMAINGTRTKLEGRPTLPRKLKVPGPLRFNATRVVPGGRRIFPGPLKKAPAVTKKELTVRKKPGPGVSTTEDSVNVKESSSEGHDDKNPTMTPGTDSETNSSEEPTPAVGSKEQPDVGMASHGSDADTASPGLTGTIQSQEKKCMNKIKVTHIRLPLKDRGSGCRGDGKGLARNTLNSNPGSPISSDIPAPGETDLDYSPDPLHTLLTDTFKGLNITTFSVHLSKPSDVSVDEETVRTQILRGLKPLPSLSSSSSLSTSESSSPTNSSSSSLTSLVSSASTEAPSASRTYLIASSLPPPPPSSSSSDKIDPLGSNELDVDNSKSTTDSVSPEDRRLPPSGKDRVPLLHHTPLKRGYIRRPHQNTGQFQNKTNLNLRIPHRSPPRFVPVPKRETETSELSSSPSSSSSDESPSDEINPPVKDTSGDKDDTTPASSVIEQNQKKMLTERGRIPVRRPPPKGGHLRRPILNVGLLQNRTRLNLRPLSRPSQPLNPDTETQTEQELTTPLSAASSLLSEGSYPSDTGPVRDSNEGETGARISTTNLSTESDQTLRVSGVPSSHRPKVGLFRRTQPHGGSFQNRTRTNLRPPQHPQRGLVRKPLPTRKLNTGSIITVVNQNSQLGEDGTHENQSGEQDVHRLNQGGQIRQPGGREAAEVTPNGQIDTTVRPQTNELRSRDNALVQTEETGTAHSDNNEESVDAGENIRTTIRGRPTLKQTSSHSRAPAPVTLPKRQPPTRTVTGLRKTQVRQYISGSQKEDDPKTSNTEQTESAASDISSSGVMREPLDFVDVTNRTSDGFTLVWDSPEGKYKNFVVTRTEKDKGPKQKKRKEEAEEDSDQDGGTEVEKGKHQPNKEPESENGGTDNINRIPEGFVSQVPKIQSSTTTKPTESDKIVKKVLPGSARSFQFEDLPPQTDYTLTLLGKGPGLLSRLHKLVISTGPEPPSNIIFSKVTENSLTVSWTKPKSPVNGFKVTYTHTDDGEPVSVTVDSEDSNLGLSQLLPGSSYEVTVISTLGLDESDPIKDFVMTLPDPPTDIRAVNVTDSTALLLWRPALAAVDKYAIVYGAGTDSELRVTVSGNAAEQQLSGLQGSTTYTVTITSQLGSLQSSAATTSFTTTGGSGRDGEGPRDLQANNVTPRTAMLSWNPPSRPVDRYRLTYKTEGQEMKEVIVDATVTQYNLSRLHPGSKYIVQLQADRGGRYTSAISTDFTTGTLRFPFPTDCSQELLNGIWMSGEVEIFPQGKTGTPIMVYCDMESDGGGWTVFQRRKDGSVDFFRGWKEYTKGFGDLSGEFWLGLESLHNLTAMTKMSLRVDLRDGDESVFAQYSTFEVAKRHYKLTVGGYTGTAGDSLTYHNNRIFSTKDRDPAPFITRCAMSYRGGWWYKNCHEANLNGLYGIDVKHQVTSSDKPEAVEEKQQKKKYLD